MQVVWWLVVAIIAASFAIIDHNLSDTVSDKLPLGRTFYFLGWMSGLWLVAPLVTPFLLLKNQPSANRSLDSVDLMAMLAALALLSFVAGQVLIAMADWLYDFSRDRWLVDPSAVNVMTSAIVVVAFLPIWRQEVCGRRVAAAVLWTVFFVISTIIYAGMYGLWFKPLNVSKWQLFSAYAAFPAVVMFVAFIAFLLPARLARFRWFMLPIGLAMGFAAVAQYSLASLSKTPGNCPLIIAHTVNGVLLGFILALWRKSGRWWGGSYVPPSWKTD